MPSLNINQIQEILPHRYPMLMVDRVLDYNDDWLLAVKNVTYNEPVFEGHFPHWPIFPGVLIIESMVQASAIMASLAEGVVSRSNVVYLFAGIDKTRFKGPVKPGDRLVIETRALKKRAKIFKAAATASVDEKVVCSSEFLFTYQEL